MSIESEFIDWINEHPGDVQTQLVYADWLEEHDWRRAEGWRLLLDSGLLPRTEYTFWTWKGTKAMRYEPIISIPSMELGRFHGMWCHHDTFFQCMSAAVTAFVWAYHGNPYVPAGVIDN